MDDKNKCCVCFANLVGFVGASVYLDLMFTDDSMQWALCEAMALKLWQFEFFVAQFISKKRL